MPFPEFDPDTAHERIPDYRIIDVRHEHEFDGPLGHIEAAELFPLPTIAERSKALTKSPPLLLVCRSGQRSAKACEQLQALGIGPVINLAGGMIAWNRAGLPVLREEPKSLDELVSSIASWLALVTGSNPRDANDKIGSLLLEAGTDPGEVTHAALDFALDALSDELTENGPPADLDLALDAFRKDLAVL